MTATRKLRWLRLVTPIALVLLIILGTVLVRWLSEPDRADKHYLSPVNSGDTSGDDLAELLRAKGITTQRETRTTDALFSVKAQKGKATLFLPAPEFVHDNYLLLLKDLPVGTRVVMVEPGARQLARAVPRLGVADKRWATAVMSPGADCALTKAGRASVTRTRYGEWSGEPSIARYCYDHGLAAIDYAGVEFVAAGSADPFRADRLSEHDNADLAVDLLSARPTLVWLDLHARETIPKTPVQKVPAPAPDRGSGERASQAEAPSPFPPWLLPAALMILLATLALAFARGRRLGGPVTEPLPIEVKGAETAIGRGNLYRRAKARGAALETLRHEARRRIAVAIGLPPKVDRERLLAVLAERLGDDPALLADILYGPVPDSDQELHQRTTGLLLLVEQVTRGKKENPSD
ncbi:MAG TPA: hypothetical protein DGG94_14125 [Micromonosporaceae bacterium]|nr:hypothetical protein [Micromonosporaceae bacterium]HCU50914.1 hypothetical protein [Micromonosporaceae bacterium]